VKRVVETTQVSKIAELEAVVAAQAQRIAKLEEAYANLKLENENVTAIYRRLADRYKKLEEKASAIECEKPDVAEAHAAQLVEVEERLVKETQDRTDYRWDVRHSLCELHEVSKVSLREVGARCLTFPTKNAAIDDYIGWFEEKVKAVLGVVWQLNDNFFLVAIEGVLNMLHCFGC
jgi:uncharacterized coiled-coil protein SlyX